MQESAQPSNARAYAVSKTSRVDFYRDIKKKDVTDGGTRTLLFGQNKYTKYINHGTYTFDSAVP